jgi:hypothetical protein
VPFHQAAGISMDAPIACANMINRWLAHAERVAMDSLSRRATDI